MTFYFAYGSNLDEGQMKQRCAGAVVGQRAELVGYRLVFRGRSRGRGGGVATVVPDVGQSVNGLLWTVGDEDLAALDQYEGYPTMYGRVRQAVVVEDGRQVDAWIYVLRRGAAQFTPPTLDYLQSIRASYARLGFDPSAIEAALDGC